MTDEQRRRGPAATGVEATGQHVRANVARLRKARGLTTYQLAQRMIEAGRPIPQSGISRIESGARRVDADDLTALAAVFGVSPAALLLPLTDSPTKRIEITGAGSVPADTAWAWATNERPLREPSSAGDGSAELEYQLYSIPPRQRQLRQHPAGRATEAVRRDMARLISAAGYTVEGDEARFRELVEQARVSLARLSAELDRIEVEQGELIRFRDASEED